MVIQYGMLFIMVAPAELRLLLKKPPLEQLLNHQIYYWQLISFRRNTSKRAMLTMLC